MGTNRKRKFWSEEEEIYLISRFKVLGPNWLRMSAEGVVQKSPGQLKDKWRNLLEKHGSKEAVFLIQSGNIQNSENRLDVIDGNYIDGKEESIIDLTENNHYNLIDLSEEDC